MKISLIISFVTFSLGLIIVLCSINIDPSFHLNESLTSDNPAEGHVRTANEILSFLLFCGVTSASLLITSKSKVESDRSRTQIFMHILKECRTFKETRQFDDAEAQQLWTNLIQEGQEEIDEEDPDQIYETDETFLLKLFKILFEFDPRHLAVAETSIWLLLLASLELINCRFT